MSCRKNFENSRRNRNTKPYAQPRHRGFDYDPKEFTNHSNYDQMGNWRTVEQLESELMHKDEEIYELETSNSKLKEDLKKLEEQVARDAQQLDQQMKFINILKMDVESLQTSRSSIESNYENEKKRCTEIEKDLTRKLDHYAEKSKTLRQELNRFKMIENDYDVCSKENTNLKNDLKESRMMELKYQEAKIETQAKLDKLEKILATKSFKIANMKEIITEHKVQLNCFNQNLKDLAKNFKPIFNGSSLLGELLKEDRDMDIENEMEVNKNLEVKEEAA